MDTTTPNPIDLDLITCPRCQRQHPKKLLLTYPEIAALVRLSVATLYSYHSRGGILPRPKGRPNGNPKWSSCAIAAWLEGDLSPADLEPCKAQGKR